jgi:5-(carboxyamino)imidazole ribonucleotide synthase
MTTARERSELGAPRTIGVVGGGQLAWMLGCAAKQLGVELQVQTPYPNDPAVRVASGVVLAAVDDAAATARLAEPCTAVSFENEWLPLEALAPLVQQGVRFLPELDALRPLISKRAQRELLNRLHLPCPPWCPLEAVLSPAPTGSSRSLEAPEGPWDLPPLATNGPRLPAHLRFPVMAKASSGGYDGKGIVPITNQAELEALLATVVPQGWLLEEQVAFEQELALVACRDQQGRVACFPLVETHQTHQVCNWVLAPAPVNHAVEAMARNVAASLLTALDYVGVLSIEFFYGPRGLQVNEIAPRTHNSGHYTIEACRSSQFDQQVRIVADLPMGSTEMVVPGALMVNLLGYEPVDGAAAAVDYGEQRQALAALADAHLHWYGKRSADPGRKLGHLTLLLQGTTVETRRGEAERRLAEVRSIWPQITAS